MQAFRVIRKLLIWALIPLAIALAVFLQFAPTKTEKVETIASTPVAKNKRTVLEIGLLAPLQGEYALEGDSLARGAKVAEALINASAGEDGRKIKIHIVDTRSNARIARDLASELVKRRKVHAILGTIDEGATLATIEQLKNGKTPFIYPANGSAKTCSEKDILKVSGHVWGLGLTQQMMTEPFIIYLADRFRQPESRFSLYYFANDTEANSLEVTQVLQTAESLGFKTVGEEYVDTRIRDLFQKVRKIFASNPEILFVSTSTRGTADFMQQASKLGIKAEMKVAGLSSFGEEQVREMRESADEVFTVARYANSITNEQNDTFLAKWKEMYPDSPPPTEMAAAGGFGGVKIIASAFEKAETLDFSNFKKGIKNLEVDLPQGKIVMSASNNLMIQPLYVVNVENAQYKISQFLGDVSHPALEDCSISQDLTEALEDPS